MMNFLRIALLALALFQAEVSPAAGFDCARASSSQEKAVCADPGLSALDGQLQARYQALMAQGDPAAKDRLRQQQGGWLRDVRDRCGDGDCLLAAYRSRLSALGATPGQQACPVSEAMLVGAWKAVSGDGFFDEMAFEVDGTDKRFNSWLDHRPEIMGGRWGFEGCVLRVRHADEAALDFSFTLKRLPGDKVQLTEVGQRQGRVYRRLRP